jgi:alanine racemase
VAPRTLQWIEINRSALIHNVREFRDLVGANRKILAVVKANAYGHGLLEVSRPVLEAGVDWLGVHSLEEGIRLRQAGVAAPILILGYVPLDDLEEAAEAGMRLTVYNKETVRKIGPICERRGFRTCLHLKLETGTHRQGIGRDKIIDFIRMIRRYPSLVVEGLTSHFANIEDTTDHRYPRCQLERFAAVVDELETRRIRIPVKHMSCTASTILFPETYFDMVRVGIGLYGLWPSKETFVSCRMKRRRSLVLRPVLSWKALVAQIKRIPKGSFIGYGCTYRTTRKTTLAVIPVGYYDGYSRGLSNASYVLIKGRRAEVRGRVAMDFIMADITDIPGVKLEDEAVLIGKSGPESITVESLAALSGTISYEVVARINPGIPRIVV